MFVPWNPGAESTDALQARIGERAAQYRTDYAAYYQAHARPDSPRLRDANPSVVVIPSLGLFGFAKDKREARITTEFFVDVFNLFDDQAPTRVQDLVAGAGADAFLDEIDWVTPRRAFLGARVRF